MKDLILVLLGLLVSDVSHAWQYGDESHWHETCRNGKKQSPINLDNEIAEVKSFEKFVFSNYDLEYTASILNNGHSVVLKLDDNRPRVWGGGLPREYILHHMHFHWQSEHTMDGYRFPLEVHLVHYASEYSNLQNALNVDDGIAVLAVFYDLSPEDDVYFDPVVKVMQNIEEIEVKSTLNMTKLSNFLPRDKAGYYRYSGSLTTPNCTENVIWTIFTNTIHISREQAKRFESVRSELGVLKKNYRSLQELGDRTLYRKISPLPHAAAPSNFKKSFAFMVVLMAVIRIL